MQCKGYRVPCAGAENAARYANPWIHVPALDSFQRPALVSPDSCSDPHWWAIRILDPTSAVQWPGTAQGSSSDPRCRTLLPVLCRDPPLTPAATGAGSTRGNRPRTPAAACAGEPYSDTSLHESSSNLFKLWHTCARSIPWMLPPHGGSDGLAPVVPSLLRGHVRRADELLVEGGRVGFVDSS